LYEPPSPEVSFGDVFAGDWFFDAYLRRDAVPLVQFSSKSGAAWRAASPSEERDFLFAHGRQRHAVLLSDDCEIETIMRRGGHRRLVFAAIERLPSAKQEMETALSTRSFRRFPLPPDVGYPGGIVEFQQLFAVATDGVEVTEDDDPRLTRLDAAARLDLEMRWNAYAARRGPLAHVDHAEKLARLLSADGDDERLARLKKGLDLPDPAHLEQAKLVAEALGAAWNIEGAGLNEVSEAYEEGRNPASVRDCLADALADLAARAQRAAAKLGE
jgi:hypothetical protein